MRKQSSGGLKGQKIFHSSGMSLVSLSAFFDFWKDSRELRLGLLCVSSASKGLLDAAHFCYLMAQVGFGVYTKKTTKLVLIGSNHR